MVPSLTKTGIWPSRPTSGASILISLPWRGNRQTMVSRLSSRNSTMSMNWPRTRSIRPMLIPSAGVVRRCTLRGSVGGAGWYSLDVGGKRWGMVAVISHLTVDSRDAYAQSVFWSRVLGWAEDPEDPNEPGHEECMIFAPDGAQRMLFVEVPEG